MDPKAKMIKYGDEAREAMKNGVEKIAKVVVTTLGPRGRNVLLGRKYGAPFINHDGVSVAKEIILKDPFENQAAQAVKDAASKTADVAGDGTTTTVLLVDEIYRLGSRQITAGANPMIMRFGMRKAVEAVVKQIEKMAKPVPYNDKEKVEQVANVSSGDPALGKLIAEAVTKVGKDGVVAVEDGRGKDVEIDYTEGMEFNQGLVAPQFVNTQRGEAELDSPYILITDRKVSSIHDLLPFIEQLLKKSKNLVLISDGLEGDAFPSFVLNKINGKLNAIPVKCPEFGDRRKEVLEDIAILTGATVFNDALGRNWDTLTLADCGRAERVWADKSTTRIIGGRGDKDKIEARINLIKEQLQDKKLSDYDKEYLEKRLAKLTSGVAVIRVGALTDTEMKEKKERVIDAVSATKAALEEGIVAGGGVTFLQARKVLYDLEEKASNIEEKLGVQIVREALERPLGMIAENSGEKGDVVINKVEVSDEEDFGFDSVSRQYGSMYKMGIIDPAKVVRCALENACSIAEKLLTTEALVVDEPEEPKQQPNNQPMMMGGM